MDMRNIAAVLAVATASGFCLPGQGCWPTPVQWATLNATVGGRLLSVVPEGTVCANDPTGSACATLYQQWTNASWRADQPSAMQAPNWETDANGNGCINPQGPCVQGDVPPFAVAVSSAEDVVATMQFAYHYNILVVVKSTGHDFQGRSTASDGLMVWTHRWKQLNMSTSFAACGGDSPVPALTVTGGVQWGDVYDYVDAARYQVVGGSARTVSANGGYTLGGGHSFMSPAYGLAVDNVLQYVVVLANGTLVTASPCSHPDLFWAMRGGGAGFGVLVATTYRMYPVPPGGVIGAFASATLLTGGKAVATVLDVFMAATPGLLNATANGGVFGGYFGVSSFSSFWAVLVFNSSSMADAETAVGPLVGMLRTFPDDINITSLSLLPYASMKAWHDVIDPGDATGVELTLGSRLVPMAACTNASWRLDAATNMTVIAQYTDLRGHLVVGGAVAANDPDSTSTSVTPAWRAAAWHLAFAGAWAANATAAETNASFTGVSTLTGILRSVFPDSGAYWSESDYLEPDWQETFWGASNYARLQAVKAAYDPPTFLTCHHCVDTEPVARIRPAAGIERHAA